jgi:hypothetical protein
MQAFTDMQGTVLKASNSFLGGSIFGYLLIAGLAAALGFSSDETTKKDEESNASGAVPADTTRQNQSNSPI